MVGSCIQLLLALTRLASFISPDTAPERIENLLESTHSTRPTTSSIPQTNSSWDLLLSERPLANSSHNLVFDSVSSLLQRWTNTRNRNGHTVVPGTIPSGTLLYHGGDSLTPPQGPEWAALDPEHSYLFAAWCDQWNSTDLDQLENLRKVASGNTNGTTAPCWHLTFTTTRPLRVLYFDGSSAAKLPILLRNRKPKQSSDSGDEQAEPIPFPVVRAAGGTLDSQDVLLWERIREDMILHDDERLKEMCDKWGRGGSEVGDGEGFDGFVRMQMSFEVILCDLNHGTRLLSALPLVAAGFPNHRGDPPPSPVMTSIIQAGSWHNAFPGETRIHLDLHRLFSFFDPELAPSLAAKRANEARWQHRIQGMSSEDIRRTREAFRNAVFDNRPVTNGINWKALFHTVIDRYSERLETIRGLLDSTTSTDDNTARKVVAILRFILTPYITRDVVPPSPTLHSSKVSSNLTWASPVFEHCSTTFTEFLFTEVELTGSEVLMRNAIYHTNQEICRVVTKMWAVGVENGLDPFFPTRSSQIPESSGTGQMGRVLEEWRNEIERLMNWLGWSVWMKCWPACGTEEICYLPTWPLLDPIPSKQSSIQYEDGGQTTTVHSGEAEVDWLNPKPRCVRKVIPYEL